MYTAILKRNATANGKTVITVEYTNIIDDVVVDKFSENYVSENPSKMWLKSIVKARLNKLEKLILFDEPIDKLVDLTDEVTEPEPIDISKEAFLLAYKNYLEGKKLFDLELITDAQLAALKSNLKSKYKSEYKDLIV